MFYTLSKILPLLIYPTGLACSLLVLALWLRRPKYARGLIISALLVIGLGGNRLVSMVLVRALEWRHPALSETTLPSADAIVVLGGGTQQWLPPRPWHEVGEAGDRVLYAARLYRAGVAPIVVVSGGRGTLDNPGMVPEANAMQDMLVDLGVPNEAIVVEGVSRNTYENGVESARLLEAHGWRHILLVTSALHMPRAYAVFARYDLEITPAPTDYLLTHSDWDFYTQPDALVMLMNVLPKAEYLEITERVIKELIGITVYRSRGWL